MFYNDLHCENIKQSSYLKPLGKESDFGYVATANRPLLNMFKWFFGHICPIWGSPDTCLIENMRSFKQNSCEQSNLHGHSVFLIWFHTGCFYQLHCCFFVFLFNVCMWRVCVRVCACVRARVLACVFLINACTQFGQQNKIYILCSC